MDKPLLGKSRFENLLWAIRPPKCEMKWVQKAVDLYHLTDDQIQELEEALWLVFRHRTNSLTDADNDMLSSHSLDEFNQLNLSTQYKWY